MENNSTNTEEHLEKFRKFILTQNIEQAEATFKLLAKQIQESKKQSFEVSSKYISKKRDHIVENLNQGTLVEIRESIYLNKRENLENGKSKVERKQELRPQQQLQCTKNPPLSIRTLLFIHGNISRIK